MKGCQNARCNTKYIKKFVFEYQEVFFTHREPIVILKGSQPVFLLLSAWLNFNIPSEIELLHNDDSKSVKQILMFSSSQGTTKLVFHTVIWESECLGMVAYLHCVANSFPGDFLVALYWKTTLSGQPFLTLISFILFILILIHQFSLIILCGSCWALGFMLSCSKGQGTLVSFSLLPVIHEQWVSSHAKFSGQFKGFQKLSIHRTMLLSQQHVMMSKCHMTCNNYITHITSIMASWYNLSQNRLKSNRFYTT